MNLDPKVPKDFQAALGHFIVWIAEALPCAHLLGHSILSLRANTPEASGHDLALVANLELNVFVRILGMGFKDPASRKKTSGGI